MEQVAGFLNDQERVARGEVMGEAVGHDGQSVATERDEHSRG
jgi:hypothetical protein